MSLVSMCYIHLRKVSSAVRASKIKVSAPKYCVQFDWKQQKTSAGRRGETNLFSVIFLADVNRRFL